MMDFVFKAIFGQEDEKSKELLIELLNAILKAREEDKIKDLVQRNPFNYKEFELDFFIT